MPRILRALKINDVSSVDRGAGKGVRVMLTKRDEGKNDGVVVDFNEAKRAVAKLNFTDAHTAIEAREDAGNLMHELNEAISALNMSVCSILDDAEVVDKSAAVAESLAQFKDHLSGLGMTEHDEETEMTKDEVQKLLDEAVAKATAAAKEENSQLRDMLTLAKMSEKHRNYFQTLDGEQKKKFSDADDKDRDEIMQRTSKRYEDDPIYKAMNAENDELRKRLQSLEDASSLEVCKREAKEMGITAADAGEVRLKVKKGDQDALSVWEKLLVEANGSLRKSNKELGTLSKAFQELGTTRGATGGNAHDEITAKAAELRKVETKLTEAQAYTKVLEDPANRELVIRERDERMAKIHRVA